MRRCLHCIRRSKDCEVGPNSDSCTECVGIGLSCELASSEVKLRRIQAKRREKKSALKEAITRTTRLQCEIKILEKDKEKLVRRELENIKELERDQQ